MPTQATGQLQIKSLVWGHSFNNAACLNKGCCIRSKHYHSSFRALLKSKGISMTNVLTKGCGSIMPTVV